MIDVTCPHCGKPLRIPEKDLGKKGKCVSCGGAFLVVAKPPDFSEEELDFEYDPKAETSPAVKARVRSDMAGHPTPKDVLSLHQLYQDLIRAYTRECVDDPDALYLVAQAALQQVDISRMAAKAYDRAKEPALRPRHEGFEKLCSIRERLGRYEEVVRLAEEAKSQGWPGDWDKRIGRCKATTVIHKSS